MIPIRGRITGSDAGPATVPMAALRPAWPARDQELWSVRRPRRSGEWWKRISYWWTYSRAELEAMARAYL